MAKAAERRQWVEVPAVDEHLPGAQFAGHFFRMGVIGRPDRAGQAIGRAVGDLDGLSFVLIRNHAQHGAEDFLLGDAAVGFDVTEHRGLDEVALVTALRCFRAACNQGGAFFDTNIDEVDDLVPLLSGSQRAQACGFFQRIARRHFRHRIGGQFAGFVMLMGRHQHAGQRSAGLA